MSTNLDLLIDKYNGGHKIYKEKGPFIFQFLNELVGDM